MSSPQRECWEPFGEGRVVAPYQFSFRFACMSSSLSSSSSSSPSLSLTPSLLDVKDLYPPTSFSQIPPSGHFLCPEALWCLSWPAAVRVGPFGVVLRRTGPGTQYPCILGPWVSPRGATAHDDPSDRQAEFPWGIVAGGGVPARKPPTWSGIAGPCYIYIYIYLS
jgi:hypothetical protein